MSTDEPTTGIASAVPAGAQTGTVPPSAGRPSLRDVTVGVAVEASETVAARLSAARLSAVKRARRSTDRTGRLLAQARQRIDELAKRGSTEHVPGRRGATELVDAVTSAFATSRVVNRVIDAQVDRILIPLVTAVLDDVLALLEAEPERVRSLLRGQRANMVDEIVGRIRTNAAAGDAVVDRWTMRLLRVRRAAPVPASTPDS
jgi:hypothetical protein